MTRCSSCDTETSGAFCRNCGAALSGRPCAGCGAVLEPGARFCSSCGAGPGGSRRADSTLIRFLPFGIGGAALAALLVVLAQSESRAPAAPIMSDPGIPSPGGAPPDISSLTPRQRFDRLYDRVMRASEGGDERTVGQFGPMALAAYAQLDTVDTDARYHVALLRLHLADPAGAGVVADTILATSNGHLFGYVVRGMAARLSGDSAGVRAAYREYLARYDQEIARDLDEYKAHKTILDRFHREARGLSPTEGADNR